MYAVIKVDKTKTKETGETHFKYGHCVAHSVTNIILVPLFFSVSRSNRTFQGGNPLASGRSALWPTCSSWGHPTSFSIEEIFAC